MRRLMEILSGSEALYGFAGWLTTRKEQTVMGADAEVGNIADKVDRFVKRHGLPKPRPGWEKELAPMTAEEEESLINAPGIVGSKKRSVTKKIRGEGVARLRGLLELAKSNPTGSGDGDRFIAAFEKAIGNAPIRDILIFESNDDGLLVRASFMVGTSISGAFVFVNLRKGFITLGKSGPVLGKGSLEGMAKIFASYIVKKQAEEK